MKPLFSVIIPTYNRGYILWRAIQSIQKQIYPNWEVLVVDDGSTDNTKQVVAEFQQDPRVRYIPIKNGGANKARNVGLKKSKGDIVTYLDSDDIFYENLLSTAREAFEKNPKAIFAIPNYNFRVELYDENYKLIDFREMGQRQTNTLTLEDIYHWKVKCASGTGLLHRRKEVVKSGIHWDESLQIFDDWDFVMQLSVKFPNKFLYIPYVLYEYAQRYGTDGACSNKSYAEFAEGFKAIYIKHKSDPFMKGQTWYPERFEKYTKMQQQVEKGEIPTAVYKYFPEFGKMKKKK